jgi:hypothetical protein
MHIGNVGRAPLMEADQHPAFLRHVAHRKAGAVAVAPEGTVDRGKDVFRLRFTDMPEGIKQHPLLDRYLSEGIEMLHRAAAAAPRLQTEMRAAGLHAQRPLVMQFHKASDLKRRLIADPLVSHYFVRQSPFDEDRFTFAMRYAAAVLIQALNLDRKTVAWFFVFMKRTRHYRFSSIVIHPGVCFQKIRSPELPDKNGSTGRAILADFRNYRR